jgi:hypothetical protein
MSRWFPIVALAAVLASVGAGTARAGDDSPDGLLGRYQPVLVLDRTERFAPIPVDAFIDGSDLERLGDVGYAVEEIPRQGLPAHGEGWRLNERGCTPAGGLASLACYGAGATPSPLIYGRYEKVKDGGVLQYWLFYEFNYWSLQYPASDLVWQAHEGDWEVVTIVLGKDREPVTAGYSQHCGGEQRDWGAVSTATGSEHPLVYVATGSHANLFAPGAHPIDLACYPQQAVDFFHAYGVTPMDFNAPGTTLGPDTALERVHEKNPGWLRFPGTWGETQYVHAPAPLGTLPFGTSPVGPAFQSEWDDPVGTIAGYHPA